MPINIPNMIGEYIVDVGDTFNLILTGMAQGTHEIMVQRDGSLILPEIGKVLSFGSILRVAEDLNNKELQSLEIAVLYSKIPEVIKKEIVTPYISVDKDEARISVRIKDSFGLFSIIFFSWLIILMLSHS